MNKQLILVAHIYNNSLGRCVSVDSLEEGIKKIKEILDESEDFDPTDEQIEDLENNYEIIFDEDPDNITTFTVGRLDNEE